jgi:hypothetical protein
MAIHNEFMFFALGVYIGLIGIGSYLDYFPCHFRISLE